MRTKCAYLEYHLPVSVFPQQSICENGMPFKSDGKV